MTSTNKRVLVFMNILISLLQSSAKSLYKRTEKDIFDIMNYYFSTAKENVVVSSKESKELEKVILSFENYLNDNELIIRTPFVRAYGIEICKLHIDLVQNENCLKKWVALYDNLIKDRNKYLESVYEKVEALQAINFIIKMNSKYL